MTKKLIIFAIMAVCFLILSYYSISIILISLIGIGIGVLLSPVLSFLRKKYKIPRVLSAIVCLFLLTLILGGALYGMWILVADQVESLSKVIPEIADQLIQRFDTILAKYPRLKKQIESLEFGATAQNLTSYVISSLKKTFYGVSGFLFALLLSLYTAVSLDEYFHDVIRAFPEKHRKKASAVLSHCATALRLCFRAQLFDMLIVGIMTAVGLWLIQLNYWAVYGLLTGVLSIIPYLGTLIVIVCVTLITLVSQPELLWWVLLVFLIVQQVEGDFILPLLMKGQVELPEVPLLIAVLLFGFWFGIVGALLAPPLFSIFRVLYLELYIPYMDQKN